MALSELFEVKRLSIEGNNYGWVATDLRVRRGLPIRIEAFGSINFCNALWQQWWFTPDGQAGEVARPSSLGHGVPGCTHAMLIGKVGQTIFPIGSQRIFSAPTDGMLSLAHNDTREVGDNEGAWDVRISVPVTQIQAQPAQGPKGRGLQLNFSGPLGLQGGAWLDLPAWVNAPRPKIRLHRPAAHGIDPQRGVVCIQTKLPIPWWEPEICVHLDLA